MSNIVKREEILDSLIISEYTKLEDLLKKSVENGFIDDVGAKNIALGFFSVCLEKVKEYKEEVAYVDEKEAEQLIQNYLKIISVYLSCFKNSEAFEMLITKSPAEIFKDAIKYYEKANLEAYNNLDYALSIFLPIKNRESILLIRRFMLMYKFFAAKLTESDIDSVSVNSDVVVYENIDVTINDLVYSDIKDMASASGFVNYVNVAKNLFYEANIIKAFDTEDVIKLINNTPRKIEIESGILVDEPISNITWTVLKQFMISSYYHKVPSEPLILNEGEAKVAAWEIFKDLIEPDEFFENLENTSIYLSYDDETKEFIKSLFHKLKYAMENLRERKINNMLIINEWITSGQNFFWPLLYYFLFVYAIMN